MYTRISTFAAAEAALVEATGQQFFTEQNWMLAAIATKFTYKIPKEFTKLFFGGRAADHSSQSGFDSEYGNAFTLALKLLQAYSLEMQLRTLDIAQQEEFIKKFQQAEYLNALRTYPIEEQLTAVFDDILISTSGKEVAFIQENPKQGEVVFGTDFQGQLDFLKWLLKHLRERVPTQDLMNQVLNYKKQLSIFSDRTLINLLNQLYSLYTKPTGYFEYAQPVKQRLDKAINGRKINFVYFLKKNKIHELFPNLFIKDPLLTETDNPHIDQTTLAKLPSLFAELMSEFSSDIHQFYLENHNIEMNGTLLNFAETYYAVLEQLALADGLRMPTIDESFGILGLNKDITTFDVFVFSWEMEKKEFLSWLKKRENAYRYPPNSPEALSEKETLQNFELKFLAYRTLYKAASFPKQILQDLSGVSQEEFKQMLSMLGIDLTLWTDLNSEKIQSYYRKAAHRYHPDRNPNNPNAAKEFALLAKYKDVLIELKNQGMAYDNFASTRDEKPTPPDSRQTTSNTTDRQAEKNAIVTLDQVVNPLDTTFRFVKENYRKMAVAYLAERRFSTWLIKHGWGRVVEFFSKLRLQKIDATLVYLKLFDNSIEYESSTSTILNLLPLDNLTNLTSNHQKLINVVVEDVRQNKGEKLKSQIHSNVEYKYKHKQIPLPIFWQLAQLDSRDNYDLEQDTKINTENAITHDGIWGKCFE